MKLLSLEALLLVAACALLLVASCATHFGDGIPPPPTPATVDVAAQESLNNRIIHQNAQVTLTDQRSDIGKLTKWERQYVKDIIAITRKTLDRAKTAASQETPLAQNHALELLEVAEEFNGQTATFLLAKGIK